MGEQEQLKRELKQLNQRESQIVFSASFLSERDKEEIRMIKNRQREIEERLRKMEDDGELE